MTTMSRRSILARASAATVSAIAASSLLQTSVEAGAAHVHDADPIFAVIAEHQAALKAYLAASAVDGRLADDTPEWEIARAVTLPAGARELAAYEAVFAIEPTTLAGVAALLEHVGQPEFLKEDREYPEDRETLLSTVNSSNDEWRRKGQDFPLRIAATIRTLIGAHSWGTTSTALRTRYGPDSFTEITHDQA
jgi:hypothetical protein